MMRQSWWDTESWKVGVGVAYVLIINFLGLNILPLKFKKNIFDSWQKEERALGGSIWRDQVGLS